jgi:hypothetical protein
VIFIKKLASQSWFQKELNSFILSNCGYEELFHKYNLNFSNNITQSTNSKKNALTTKK